MSVPFSKGDFPFFLFQEHGASLLAFINSPKSCRSNCTQQKKLQVNRY